MALGHTAASPRRALSGMLLSILVFASMASAPAAAPVAAAVNGPVAAIIVGPVGSKTAEYLREARRLASQLRADGASVREVYSPNATWSRVTAAARGANLLVYLGHGRGHPGPYGPFSAASMNGLGLNRALAGGHRNVRHFGESYIRRSIRLDPGAIVVLGRVPYAAGSSEPGRALPTRAIATRRADNYAAGFLRAGAAAVFASDHSVGGLVSDLFSGNRSMQTVFWRSPWTSTRYDSTFRSTRTSGVRGILAPYGPGRYFQSVVGRLAWTTANWRQTWSHVSPTGASVRVTTIPALLDALADNAVTDIVVANGTYRVSPAGNGAANSLWIGERFAGRTNPVTVRAETRGGVTFDGGGTTYFGGLSFEEGAHHQTWDGFTFANGQATATGVVTFGGYAGRAAPHHITLRHITIAASCTGRATGASSPSTDHAIYFAHAVGGPHDLLLEDIAVDGSGGLASALHFFHSDSANQNAWNVTVRRLTVNRTQQAIILWDKTVHDVTVDGATLSNALSVAVRYEGPGSDIAFRNITSTGSGKQGFYSSLGSSPPGVTFSGNSFD